MLALAGDILKSAAGSAEAPRIRVSASHSGFNISEREADRFDRSALAETAGKLTGVMMIPAGGIVLFLPGLLSGPAQIATQAGMLAAFVAVGLGLHRYANRGFRRKIQVDAARGELRIGTINARGQFHLQSAYTVGEIESFFIVRSKDARTPAKLKMRLRRGAQTVAVIEGGEPSLVPLLEKITLTLRPPQMRNRSLRTKTTGRFIRMSFD